MTIWLTADTHFGHDAIIQFAARPFADTAEMNRTLIENILGLVQKKDTLYVLGDYAWNQRLARQITEHLQQYVPDIRFIQGNHDKGLKSTYAECIRFDHRKYLLTHYPLATMAPGMSNVHGHCHGTYHEKVWQVDVGVDAVGYAPVNMEWVAEHTLAFSRKDEDELVEAIMLKFGSVQQEAR